MKKSLLFRVGYSVFGLMLLLIGSLAGVSHAEIVPVEVQKLLPSDGMEDEWFGYGVAMNGDTIVVVTKYENDVKLDHLGAGYVFEKKNNVWVQVAKLTASDGAEEYWQGTSVAMSGDTVVIGNFRNPDQFEQGAVYVFEKPAGGWSDMTETAKLTPSDGEGGDFFGFSVAIDRDTVVVGAWRDDSGKGSVYVFDKPIGGWSNMTETFKLTASDGQSSDNFGTGVGINGETIVVGTPRVGDNFLGISYVFIRNKGQWEQAAKLAASDAENWDVFGNNVAIFEDTIAVSSNGDDSGKGSVYVFVMPAGGWVDMTETAKLTASDGQSLDFFGEFGLAINETMIAVGASSDDSAKGSVYVFEKPKGMWSNMNEIVILKAVDGEGRDGQSSLGGLDGDLFGRSVAISGETILVGSIGDDNGKGSVYIFQLNESSFVPNWDIYDR